MTMFALWLSAVVAVTVEGGADGVEVEAVPLPGLVQVVLALRVAHPPPDMVSGTLYTIHCKQSPHAHLQSLLMSQVMTPPRPRSLAILVAATVSSMEVYSLEASW